MEPIGDSGLSEYLSREARFKLVTLCCDALGGRKWGRPMRGSRGVVTSLATLLDVTERTVRRWLDRGIQSCDVNAEKIVEIGLSLNSKGTEKILFEDLENHRNCIQDTLSMTHPEPTEEPEEMVPVE